jgi:hypothetical protein
MIFPYPPHGVCWLWNDLLITLHLIGDLGTGFYYLLIPAIAVFIYRKGNLQRIRELYPKLWKYGSAFVLICAVNHLLAALEIWVGGGLYYLSGINKILMVFVSGRFAHEFFKSRWEIIDICRVIERIHKERRLG